MPTTRLSRIVRVVCAPLVVAGALAAAAPAMAVDYCVDTTCGGVNASTFQQALDLAAISTTPDRIFLGAGTYIAPVATGFSYYKPGDPVEVIGVDSVSTVVTGPPGMSGHVLHLFGGPGTAIHDLRILLPMNVVAGTDGLSTDAYASHISVFQNPTQVSGLVGVVLDGGTLENANVGLSMAQTTGGVVFDGNGGTVRQSGISARNGITSSNGGGTITRTSINAVSMGVAAARNTTSISSSTIYVNGSSGRSISAYAYPGTDTTVHVDNVDLIGETGQNSIGVEATNLSGSAQAVHVDLRNSVMLDVTQAINSSSAGSGAVEVSAAYSDYDGTLNVASGANGKITESYISHFGTAAFGPDYDEFAPDSPLIDAGDPATEQGQDIYGKPLVTDGNHDGVARRDIGSVESAGALPAPPAAEQPPAPGAGLQIPAPVADPAVVPASLDTLAPLVSGLRLRSHGTRLRYRLSEPAKVTIRIVKGRGGHAVRRLTRAGAAGANVVRIGGRALRPGRYRALVSATDAAGNKSPTRSLRFRVIARTVR